jgi:hypothetical protein
MEHRSDLIDRSSLERAAFDANGVKLVTVCALP